MKRFWGRALSTAATAAIGGSIIPACAHNDASLFIRHVMAPPASTNGACTYQSDPAQPFLSAGLVDAALTTSYSPTVLVGNQMIPSGQADQVRAETARVTVQGAFVKIVDPSNGAVVMDNTVLTATTIDPGTGTQPNWAPVGVTMMNQQALAHFDPGTVGAPSKVAVAYIKVYGQTLGGQSVETNEFQFPIYVCHGCLVVFPAGAEVNNACAGSVSSTTTSSSNVAVPCALGQDQPAECTLCYPNPVCDPKQR
jgi:hypothetical protein